MPMQITECPQCGAPITDEMIESPHQQLILASGQLVAAAAVIGLMLEHPDYAPARPGFEQRMSETVEQLRQIGEEVGGWGEAYDDGE